MEQRNLTNEFDQTDIDANKVMAVLSYLGFLVIIPILAAKESKFAQFHANQGLVLFIAEVAFGIVVRILGMIIPILGTILGLLWIVFTILSILGIVNAAQGTAKELPVIGSYKILK